MSRDVSRSAQLSCHAISCGIVFKLYFFATLFQFDVMCCDGTISDPTCKFGTDNIG